MTGLTSKKPCVSRIPRDRGRCFYSKCPSPRQPLGPTSFRKNRKGFLFRSSSLAEANRSLTSELPLLRYPSGKWYWKPERLAHFAPPLLLSGGFIMGISSVCQVLDLNFEHATASLEDSADFFFGAFLTGMGLWARKFRLSPRQIEGWISRTQEARSSLRKKIVSRLNENTMNPSVRASLRTILTTHSDAEFQGQALYHFADAYGYQKESSRDSRHHYLERYTLESMGINILLSLGLCLAQRHAALEKLPRYSGITHERARLEKSIPEILAKIAVPMDRRTFEGQRAELANTLRDLKSLHLKLARRDLEDPNSPPIHVSNSQNMKVPELAPRWLDRLRVPFKNFFVRKWLAGALGIGAFAGTLLINFVNPYFNFGLDPGTVYSLLPWGLALGTSLMILRNVFRTKDPHAAIHWGSLAHSWIPQMQVIYERLLDHVILLQEKNNLKTARVIQDSGLFLGSSFKSWVEQVHLLYRQGKIQELENWAKNLIYQEKLAQYLLILIEKNDASSEEKINQYTRSDTRDWQALMGDLEKSFL